MVDPFTTTREIAHSDEEETETGNIACNLPGHSDDGLEQDSEDVGVPGDPISDYLAEWE